MRILEDKGNTIIENLQDFDLAQTLECGQCFRYYKQADEDYVVVAYNHLLHLIWKDDRLILKGCSRKVAEEIWIPYFDLERDYGEIKKILLSRDDKLEKAINDKYGIRILNQEFHETLISFIISQNKQIPHIKELIKRISERYGKYMGEVNGDKYYAFPDVEALGKIREEEYREMKTGFRAPYLVDASRKLATREITADTLKSVSEEDTRNRLTQIKGVGEKVANCIMLFSLGFRSAFPIDVWIKRIMENLYFDGRETSKKEIAMLASELYGEYGGYAQQYLFCYGRGNKVGIK